MNDREPRAPQQVPAAPPEPHSPGLRRFLGWTLFVTGIAMLGVCGTCTGGFLIYSMLSPGTGFVTIVLIVGGIPTAVGALAFWQGRRIVKG